MPRQFYALIEMEGMCLSDAAKIDIPRLGRDLCVLYSQLSAEAFAAGVRAWKLSPKHHHFQHLCEWQAVEYGNPRFYWVYADEDLVGHMIEVAHSCHPRTMAATAMFKWMLFAFPDP